MKLTWRTELAQWVLLMVMFALAAVTWSHAPERIPSHWNVHGEIDGWSGRFMGLLFLPLVAMGLYLLLAFIPRLDPGRANYERFGGVYAILRTTIMLLLFTIYAVTHAVIRGATVDMNLVLGLAVGAMFVVFGNLLGKVRPNWFVGVRTPWTLSSKLSWTKTHRLAGWMFLGCGLLVLVGTLVHPKWAAWFIIATVVPTAIAPIVYSYFAWRADPDKLSPAGTQPASE